MLNIVPLNTKEIQSYCHDNDIVFHDFIYAAILQTYLRLTGDYFIYFPDDKKLKVIDFIKDSANVYESMELPFEINICPDKNSFTVTYKENELSDEIKNHFLKCTRTVMSEMILKEYVYDVRLLSAAEEQEVYKVSTGTPLQYDEKETWIDVFINHAKVQPDHTAVVDLNGSITYKELDELSNIIAYYLLENKIQMNDFVAIKTLRRKEYIIALMGINKAGAAFVPIDAEYPGTLCEYIMKNSEAKMILTDCKIKEILSDYHDFACSSINKSNPDSLTYMIYTSGTTGNPKGVMIRHKSIKHCSAWIIPYFGLDNTKRNLVHSTFSFDASILDILFPLIAGGAIYIVDEDTRMNFRLMTQYIEKNKITGFSTSYALGREFLSRSDINVDYVMLGGEAFLPFKKVPFRLINAYGPTEFTIVSTVHDVKQDKDYVPPIGGAIPGSTALVVDCFMKPVPLGIPGELCLSGTQIAAGYCNNKAATEKGFVTLDNGLEFYRTGDLVKYNNENELDFLGRIDRQVKLRGFRIVINETCIMSFDYQEAKYVKAEDREDFYQIVLPIKNEKLEELCSRYDISPNALFMGCYLLTMYKQTKKDKLCVSWIYNGRDLRFANDCIGLMINLLFVNCEIDEEQSIDQFLEHVKSNMNQSLSGSSYNGYAIRDLLKEPICCFQYQDLTLDKPNELFKERIELPNPLFEPAFSGNLKWKIVVQTLVLPVFLIIIIIKKVRYSDASWNKRSCFAITLKSFQVRNEKTESKLWNLESDEGNLFRLFVLRLVW